MAERVRRSWLLVPAHDEGAVQEAQSCAADVVVLDMVELVPEAAKSEARLRVMEAVAALSCGGAEVFVQVDKKLLYADLSASVWPGLAGVVIARAESPGEVLEATDLMDELEAARGLLPGTLQVVASLDTANGNCAAVEVLSASGRVWGATLGMADLVMDLRPEPSGEIHLMPYLMQRLIIVARATGVVPLGAWWRDPARGLLAGAEETYEAAFRGRKIGFKGALCVRPEQVQPLNQGFTPTLAEVVEARRTAVAYAEAEKSGTACTVVGRRRVDLPAARQARELLTYAETCAATDGAKSGVARQAG